MKRIILGSRSVTPAFFDMSCRWKRDMWHQTAKPNADNLGGGFRVGDKAVAYVFLAHWRKNFPNRKLVIIDDPFIKGPVFSKEIPLDLVFKNIADEIWIADEPKESIEAPSGEPLYTAPLLDWWDFVGREVSKSLNVEIELTGAKELTHREYVTIIPVFDTGDNWRNISVDYWLELIDLVAAEIPTITISRDEFPKPVSGEFFDDLDVWETFNFLKNSRLHISGETGTTLWASIFGTPTLAFYDDPIRSNSVPLEFSGPVTVLGKDHPVQEAAQKIIRIYEHEKRSSFSNMHL